VYIDKKAAEDMGLNIDDLRTMANQPEKYVLSKHLTRQLVKTSIGDKS